MPIQNKFTEDNSLVSDIQEKYYDFEDFDDVNNSSMHDFNSYDVDNIRSNHELDEGYSSTNTHVSSSEIESDYKDEYNGSVVRKKRRVGGGSSKRRTNPCDTKITCPIHELVDEKVQYVYATRHNSSSEWTANPQLPADEFYDQEIIKSSNTIELSNGTIVPHNVLDNTILEDRVNNSTSEDNMYYFNVNDNQINLNRTESIEKFSHNISLCSNRKCPDPLYKYNKVSKDGGLSDTGKIVIGTVFGVLFGIPLLMLLVVVSCSFLCSTCEQVLYSVNRSSAHKPDAEEQEEEGY